MDENEIWVVTGFDQVEWEKSQRGEDASPRVVFASAISGQVAVAGVVKCVQGFVPTGVVGERELKSLLMEIDGARAGVRDLVVCKT